MRVISTRVHNFNAYYSFSLSFLEDNNIQKPNYFPASQSSAKPKGIMWKSFK